MTSPKPSVSVIVPLYNSGDTIERTLRSVAAQTLAHHEVIVVDDGSTDDGPARVARLAASDTRLKLVRQPNRGLAAARNRGLAETRAAYVAPIDADDLWAAQFLERLVAALDHDHAAPFAYAYSVQMDAEDRLLSALAWSRPPRHDFAGLLSLNSVGNGSAAVFRRAAIDEAGGYDESLLARAAQGAEDWKLVLRLARGGQPALVPELLVGYRQTPTAMSKARPRRQLAAIEAVIEDVRNDYPEVSATQIADARTMMIAWLLPSFIRRGEWADVTRLAVRAYIVNPTWVLNADVRGLHLMRLRQIWRLATGRSDIGRSLAAWTQDGRRPFACLDATPPLQRQAR